MKDKYWKQTLLKQTIIWCKVICKCVMEVRAMSIHTCQWSSQLTVASLLFDRAKDQMTVDPFQSLFFQNVVTILLSQISFSVQFPERSSTSVLRLECTQNVLYLIPIKHQKLGICNRNHNYFVQQLFSVSAVVSYFYVNIKKSTKYKNPFIQIPIFRNTT